MKQNIIEEIAVLDKVLPVVVRVHGGNHPELKEILETYETFKNGGGEKEIAKIRELTNNFALPKDACQAYTKVYNALSNIDKCF